MANSEYQALKSALLWHIDAGVDAPLQDQPGTMLGPDLVEAVVEAQESVKYNISSIRPVVQAPPDPVLLGASEARTESLKLALAAQTLDDLRDAIAGFEGIGIKENATNMVFADGNPASPIMLIGDAPGAEDDRIGKPFAGTGGQLLDKILKTAGLDRTSNVSEHSIYISNILNWRPPGNRSPTPAEIEVSLPFIERHIQLVQPKIILLVGAVAAQTLLGSPDSISKLRGKWQDYLPQIPEMQKNARPIPALTIYHPESLLQTPVQKRLVWADMLDLLEKRKNIGIIN